MTDVAGTGGKFPQRKREAQRVDRLGSQTGDRVSDRRAVTVGVEKLCCPFAADPRCSTRAVGFTQRRIPAVAQHGWLTDQLVCQAQANVGNQRAEVDQVLDGPAGDPGSGDPGSRHRASAVKHYRAEAGDRQRSQSAVSSAGLQSSMWPVSTTTR